MGLNWTKDDATTRTAHAGGVTYVILQKHGKFTLTRDGEVVRKNQTLTACYATAEMMAEDAPAEPTPAGVNHPSEPEPQVPEPGDEPEPPPVADPPGGEGAVQRRVEAAVHPVPPVYPILVGATVSRDRARLDSGLRDALSRVA